MICQGLALKKKKKNQTANEFIQMKIPNGDPVIKMKALNILKVHNNLYRAHKKFSVLTKALILKNHCRVLKKIDLLVNL